jgi:hypothetical protein
MLPVSLDCIFVNAPLVFSNVYLSCVLCTLCCQFLWIVYFWMPLWYAIKNIQSRETGNMAYTRHRTNKRQRVPKGQSKIHNPEKLATICLLSRVPYVVSFSGLSICDCPFGILWRLFVLCLVYPMLSDSLDCPFVITPWQSQMDNPENLTT